MMGTFFSNWLNHICYFGISAVYLGQQKLVKMNSHIYSVCVNGNAGRFQPFGVAGLGSDDNPLQGVMVEISTKRDNPSRASYIISSHWWRLCRQACPSISNMPSSAVVYSLVLLWQPPIITMLCTIYLMETGKHGHLPLGHNFTLSSH